MLDYQSTKMHWGERKLTGKRMLSLAYNIDYGMNLDKEDEKGLFY